MTSERPGQKTIRSGDKLNLRRDLAVEYLAPGDAGLLARVGLDYGELVGEAPKDECLFARGLERQDQRGGGKQGSDWHLEILPSIVSKGRNGKAPPSLS